MLVDDETKQTQASLEELYQTFSLLESKDEVGAFLNDLCTPSELRAMADRWRVAKLVAEGIPYRCIHEKTGVSTATITRVARSLTYGAKGYQALLKRLKEETNA